MRLAKRYWADCIRARGFLAGFLLYFVFVLGFHVNLHEASSWRRFFGFRSRLDRFSPSRSLGLSAGSYACKMVVGALAEFGKLGLRLSRIYIYILLGECARSIVAKLWL